MPRRALVIVTTYERLGHLKMAARGWLRQTFRDFSLTVADDGSGPETAAFVREFAAEAPFPVRHVWQENRGFRRAKMLNEAVRRSEGEPLIIFTDGDCIPPATFLEKHVAVHGPRSFQVGGAWMLSRAATEALTPADVDSGRHERLGRLGHRWKQVRRAWKSHLGLWLRRPHRPKVHGSNLGIDRALLEEVNGYDENFVGYGLEDSDLRDRVMATTPRPVVRILYGKNDTVHAWHPPAATAGRHLNKPYYETERPARCAAGLIDERAPRPADASPA